MSMEKNCVFCKIIRGEAPSTRLFEDDLVLAFLDIAPVSPGHALIIPKEHHVSITTVPEEYRARMMETAPRLGAALLRAVDGEGFNLLLSNGACAGQVVPHSHLHVIPRKSSDNFSLFPPKTADYKNEEEREAIAEAVRKKMSS